MVPKPEPPKLTQKGPFLPKTAQFGLAGAVLMVALPALLPYHADPLRTFYQDWLALVLGLAAALPLLWPRRSESIAIPPLALGLAGLALVLAVQAAIARVTFIESSAAGILYIAWAALVVMTGARIRETFGLERAATLLQAAFAAGGFLLAVTGFQQFYHLDIGGFEILAPPDTQGMVGAIGQRNYFANLVACGLASIAFLDQGGKLRRSIAVLIAVPMIVALALSGSRSAWVFLGIIAVSLALVGRKRPLLAASAIAASLLALGAWAKFAGVHADGDAQRMILALQAWRIFLEHPLLGAGWAEFAWNAFVLAPPPLDKHCHNLVLQLLAETGIAGAACVLVPLALWLRRFPWRAPKAAEGWLLATAAIQLAQAMIELPHWHAYLLGPFALVVGLGSCTAVRYTLYDWWHLAPRAILAGAIAVATVAIGDYRLLERWTAEASAAQRAGRPLSEEMLAGLRRLDASMFAPQVELIAAQLLEDGDPAAQLALIERAMHAYPLPALVARREELFGRRSK